ncbi:MAG: hypothetical protein ACTSVI_05980 [Promethearchaeota archaeon]
MSPDEEKSLVVKSAVKEFIKAQGCKTSSEIIDKGALNDALKALLKRACERAVQNKRTTIYARDL